MIFSLLFLFAFFFCFSFQNDQKNFYLSNAIDSGVVEIEQCKFEWTAASNRDVSAEQMSAEQAQQYILQAFSDANANKHECATLFKDFEYKFCFESAVPTLTQTQRPQHWQLGKQVRFVSTPTSKTVAVMLEDGTACEQAPNKPRVSRLFFVPSGDWELKSVEERKTCVYNVVVGVPNLLPSVAPFFAPAQIDPSERQRWQESSWTLKSGTTADNRVFCTVYDADFGARDFALGSGTLTLKSDRKMSAGQCKQTNNEKIQDLPIISTAAGTKVDFEKAKLKMLRISCDK